MPVGKIQEKKYEIFFCILKVTEERSPSGPDPLVRDTYGSADLDPGPHQNVNTGCKNCYLLPEYFELAHLQEVRQVQDVLHNVVLQNILQHKALTYVEYSTELCLASSKILTPPHPFLHPASVPSPRTKGGGYTLAGRWGGWGPGGSIFRKTRDIG